MDMGIWNWAARRFIFLFLWFVPAANAIGLNYVFMEVRNKVDLSRESLQLCANVDLNLFRVATEKEEAVWS